MLELKIGNLFYIDLGHFLEKMFEFSNLENFQKCILMHAICVKTIKITL